MLTVELLVGPEVVELRVGQLVQGVDTQPPFARGMIMTSALTVSDVALCLVLLAYLLRRRGRQLAAGEPEAEGWRSRESRRGSGSTRFLQASAVVDLNSRL